MGKPSHKPYYRGLHIALALLLLLLPLLLAFLQAPAGQARGLAPASAKECKGLDIVFLIDQSNSMVNTNDRENLRWNAVRSTIEILGDNAIYFCPGSKHRLAVVGFGDKSDGAVDTAVYIGATTVISGTVEDLAAWGKQRAGLKNALNDAERMGSTDYLSAFNKAAEIFQYWDEHQQEQVGTTLRKRAIVMVTDGGPCVIDEGCLPERNTFCPANIAGYMERLYNTTKANFEWSGADNPRTVYIWMIAFYPDNPDCYATDPRIRPTLEKITKEHHGELMILQPGDAESKNTDLASNIVSITDSLLGSQIPPMPCNVPIWIDPYVSQVAILHFLRHGANPGVPIDQVAVRIERVSRGEAVTIYENGAVTLGDGRVNDYTRDGLNERYVFQKPTPGKYMIRVTGADICEHLDVRYGRSGVEAHLVGPADGSAFEEWDEAPYYDQANPIYFQFQLLEHGQQEEMQPLVENPSYPLTLTLRIQSPTDYEDQAVDEEYLLARTDDSQAIYSTVWDLRKKEPRPLALQYPGDYDWTLRAYTPNPHYIEETTPPPTVPHAIAVVTVTGSFHIDPKEWSLGLDLQSPRSGEEIRFLEWQQQLQRPLQVRVQVTDAAMGTPLPDRLKIAPPRANPLQAKLIGPQGNVLDTQFMAPLAGNIYTATLGCAPGAPLRCEPGAYQVTVEFTGDYYKDRFLPQQSAATSSLTSLLTQRFYWHIVEPLSQTYTIHPQLGFFPPPKPVPLVVQVELENGDLLPPRDLIESPGAVLFTGQLYVPGSSMPVELEFHPGEKMGRFEAEWPDRLAASGDYTLKVSPHENAAPARWVPAQMDVQSRTFSRADTLLSQPWALLALILSGIAIILLAILLWNVATRPVGLLTFVHPGTGAILHEEYLRGILHTFKSHNRSLKYVGVSKLVVTRGKPDPQAGKGGRCVAVEVYDEKGEPYLSDTLYSGDIAVLGNEATMRYD